MSEKTAEAAWNRRTDSPNRKLVLMAMIHRMDEDGIVQASLSRLSEMTELSDSVVGNAIKGLAAKGLIIDHSEDWQVNLRQPQKASQIES